MVLSVVPYIGLVCISLQYIYPAIETVRTGLQGSPSGVALTQWTVFWILCVSYMFLETHVLYLFAEYLPLYQEMKALVLLWLVHPTFQGAAWLWYCKLKGLHGPLDEKYHSRLIEVLGPLGQEEGTTVSAQSETESGTRPEKKIS
mmetsp:Transcript_52388/g.113517  ORF Transcript_52388/g.113517 Transcript_52388/m.113517 type:complete len:145 (-) Transcript_52388:142-576(-)